MTKVLSEEKKIGIDIFITKKPGVKGKIRSIPDDFCVSEISKYPKEKKDGKFVIAEVKSKNWETNQLVKEISDKLSCSRNRVSFAGTKDKRAITKQLMAFFNMPTEKIKNIKIRDVDISNIYRSNESVRIGDLVGNSFEIKIRDIKNDYNFNNVEKITEKIKGLNGFPNFFGIQRFGIIRPITHIVGKNIINDDYKKAVMAYIANPIDKQKEKDDFYLRKELEEKKDFHKALNTYPNHLNFEKAILNKLVQKQDDYISALKELPKNLLTMFVYAYQSYLFNKILSERIKRKIPINQAIVGDIILPIRKGLIESEEIPVTDFNIEKVNKKIKIGKAVVSGVLFGYETVFSKGEMGEIEHRIIESENIDHRDFIVPDIPYISSKGLRRPILAITSDLKYEISDDEINKGKKALKLSFKLHKGSYATCLIREYMKSDDIISY